MLKLTTLADKTLTLTGTLYQVVSVSTRCSTVIVNCKKSSTGPIYVGDANTATTRGVEVESGESISISADNSGRAGGEELDLLDLYFVAGTAGDIVKVSYLERK